MERLAVLLLIFVGAACGEETFRLGDGDEVLRNISVASSGQLLARSSEAVYLLSSSGQLESQRSGRAVAFLQTDDLSPEHALLCSNTSCQLLLLSDLNTVVWSVNVFLHELEGGVEAASILTKKSDTELSLNTAQVNPGSTSVYLDAIRYDYTFSSTNFLASPPSGPIVLQSTEEQLRTDCTGEFLDVFSFGTDTFYVAVARCPQQQTHIYHSRNELGGLGRTINRFEGSNVAARKPFICLEDVSVSCEERTAADHAHFSRAANEQGHRLFFTFGELLCQYDFDQINSMFSLGETAGCKGTAVDPSLLMDLSSFIGGNEVTVTALGSTVVEDHMFLLVAVSNRSIYQFLVTSSAILLDNREIPHGEVAMDIVSSKDGLNYFVMTRTKIHKFPVHNCDMISECGLCVQSANPLCGWCSVSGRCGLPGDCPNSGMQNRFVTHGNDGNCPSITTVTPNSIEIINILNITLTTANVPVDASLNYHCRFLFDRNGVNFTFPAQSLGGGAYRCPSPSMVDLDPIVRIYAGEASPRLQLIRFVDGGGGDPRVITMTTGKVTFFDCQSYEGCGGCASQSTCQWCAPTSTCDAQGKACPIPYTDVASCPQIVSSGPNSLVAHVNQTKGLRVPVSFQDSTLPSDVDYKCVFTNSGGIRSEVAGTLQSSFINCDPHLFSTSDVGLQSVEISFPLSSSGGRIYQLDNPSNQQVKVYDCASSSVDDCSSCLALPQELNCSYSRQNLLCVFAPHSSLPQTLLTASPDCPIKIEELMPAAGPVEGGTTVTIKGFNLPLQTNEVSVAIGNITCAVLETGFVPAKQLQCKTASSAVTSQPIRIQFKDASNQSRTVQSSELYSFEVVHLVDVTPKFGIVAGGTILTVRGPSLLSGSSHKVELEGETESFVCPVIEEAVDPDYIQCLAPPNPDGGSNLRILVTVDNREDIAIATALYSYEDNPEVNSITPNQSLAQGGIPFKVAGKGFEYLQTPKMEFLTVGGGGRVKRQDSSSVSSAECRIVSSILLECPSPSADATPPDGHVTITLRLDGLTVPDQGPNVTVLSNPTFEPIAETLSQVVNNYADITIQARNINPSFVREFLTVAIGNSPLCKVTLINTDRVVCRPGNITDGMVGVTLNITVQLGNQRTVVGHITFERQFDYLLLVVLPVVAVLVGGAVLALLVGCCLCLRRVTKKSGQWRERVDELQEELHQIESSVVSTVKAGFAELNAEVEETYGDQMHQSLPFRSVPSFVHHAFFQEESPALLTEPLSPSMLRSRDFVQGLADFKRLLYDRKFLFTVVTTLEDRKSFDITNRSQFATLLMVALCGKLDYATDVLKQLLSEQIRQLSAKGETHLFMRKTQSVSDKMLSCWLALCLREHMEGTSGYPLYMLYRATRTQLDKGPVDIVTGECKYSLSERSILRSMFEKVEEITTVVETEDGGRHIVKLLDCDTATQAKEKIIDFAFRSVKASQRHTLQEVDLQFRTEGAEPRLLRDEDKSSLVEGTWRRINTLKHYKVPRTGAIFRLVPRKESPPEGQVFDHIGTLVASHTLSRRHRLSSITSNGLHLWHLSKQTDHTNGTSPFAGRKLMTEIFFPQMMYTKNVLQKYVDDFVEAAFTVYGKSPYNGSPGSTSAVYANLGTNEVPHAVKFLFDFLEEEAADNDLHNPSILHVWKCNSLNLRFWVNFIKNPEFMFDVQKSHAVDSCLSVVAQALMDSCSTTEEVLTRDSPAGRLLFHKDVRRYRQSIKKYFEDVRRRPALAPQQMKNYLQNLSHTYTSELLHARGDKGVDMNRVLYELFDAMATYSEEIEEALDGAGLFNQSQTFRSVKQSLS